MLTGMFHRSVLRALATLLALLWCALPAVAQPRVVDQAQFTSLTPGTTATTTTTPVSLPYHWDQRQGPLDGLGVFTLQIPVTDTLQPLALAIPRLGNSYAIRVNGVALASFGTIPNDRYEDAAPEPRYFVVPVALLKPLTEVQITVSVVGGRRGGLSRVTAGLESDVAPLHRASYFWQVTATRFVAIISGVLGALALLLWAGQRDRVYLYYGIGELLWSLQTMRALITAPPVPWPWWGVLTLAAFNAAPPLLTRFALGALGAADGWVAKTANTLIIFALPAAVLSIVAGQLWMVTLWQTLMLVNSVAMVYSVISNRASTAEKWEVRVLAVAVVVICATAVRDFLMLRLTPDTYDLIPWTRFTWMLFGLSLTWIIAERLRKSHHVVREMNAQLTQELADRSAELHAAFDRSRDNEKERGAAEERQRLMRDLHDGLGSQLVGALRMAQQPEASRSAITAQLREAVDQLKITVDAMQETDGDIAAVLGALRYRLAPRLESAGIDLQWNMGRLPVMAEWGVRQSYQLQMILLEVFTNMVVHSGATCASLSATQVTLSEGGAIQIDVTDNGKGFLATQPTPGKGLPNIQIRAKALGIQLTIQSAPGSTHIRLTLQQKD
jgi:signal transduction histidine kinase